MDGGDDASYAIAVEQDAMYSSSSIRDSMSPWSGLFSNLPGEKKPRKFLNFPRK